MSTIDLVNRVKKLECINTAGKYPAVMQFRIPEDFPTIAAADKNAREIRQSRPGTMIMVFADQGIPHNPAKYCQVFDREDVYL
jgi:hypothetical protein